MRALFFSWFAMGLTLLSSDATLHAAPITVVDLGGLGGSESVAYRINANGMIVGWSQLASGATRGFYTDGNGVLTQLNVPGNSDTFARAINDSGTIAGVAYIGGQSHGILWNGSTITDFGPNSGLTAINASGQVTGGNGSGHAFISSNGATTDLGALSGGGWTAAYGINDSGMVAGYGDVGGSTFRAFVGSAQTGLTQLGTLGGWDSWATGINNKGQVIGHAEVASGYSHAFVTGAGKALVDLGTLGGPNVNSIANGINSLGAIVGSSYLTNGAQHGFVFSGGQMLDLNSFLTPNSGWVLNQAFGIDNFGNVVGTGTFNGKAHAFLLDPLPLAGPAASSIPEPGTFALIGIAGLAFRAFRRRR